MELMVECFLKESFFWCMQPTTAITPFGAAIWYLSSGLCLHQVSCNFHASLTFIKSRNGIPIGLQAASSWLNIYPQGIRYLLNHTKDTYKNPNIYITENGYDEFSNTALSLEEALDDTCRIQYYGDHLKNVLKSIKEYNVKVKGFFVWSYADNFEWECGYTVRFGLYYIDYANDLKRHPKRSVKWFKNFLRKNSFGDGLTWSRPFGFKNPGGISAQ
ncbi:hypothetical protein Tsubulata_045177 [Turnera subulata]|uniref:Beta-glucosidase n=1 Tax=Turnera subulata TaxID=218843 RepID=A0A9Q0JPX0_9ROSI|nr:hypothetical protein Tsubulata_045177 [Turnera subulata]